MSTRFLDDDPQWYKNAIIYELHIRSFADSNADGIGDFRGLTERLDYLQDLGVTALWLLPFYPSPLRDDGYDIADYTDVNPIYGSLADFRSFLREAHGRGLRVITELVLNHTSDQHPWFQRARRQPSGSSARDFYVWSDSTDRYKDARVIFRDFESSNWSWDDIARAYYWHRFYSHQPDLNFDNPAVHQAVFAVVDFWLGLGIDGMRLDAVPYLYEREGTNCENLPESHAFLKKLRAHIDERFRNRMLLAEANQWPEDAVTFFGDDDECQMAFHFPLMPRLFMAIQMEDRFPVIDILQQTPAIPDRSQWALFLRNHDELTLETVSDEDRDYMYRVYAQDPHARINLGIRRRLAPLLENHRARIELMNGLLFSLPGTPVLYYGDEIGMGDNVYLGDRNGVRTPMQWNAERNAGFSRGNPQRLFLPVNIDPEYHYQTVNVEAQQNNPHSLLWWMKHLIALRKQHAAFGRGTLEFLTADNRKVLAFLRSCPRPPTPDHDGSPSETARPAGGGNAAPDPSDERILVVANLSRFVQHAALDLSSFKGLVPVEMRGRSVLPPVGEGPYGITLSPFAFYWLELLPASEVARQRKHSGQALTVAGPPDPRSMAKLEIVGDWQNIFRSTTRAKLGAILLDYMREQPWFTGSGARPLLARVVENAPIPCGESSVNVLLVQVEYAEDEMQTFVVPLAFAFAAGAERILRVRPQAVVCRLRVVPENADAEGRDGILCDPLGEAGFSWSLLAALARRRRFRGNSGELTAWNADVLPRLHLFRRPRPEPALDKTLQRITMVTFGDRAVLKTFRSVEPGTHPEVEIGRALAEKTSFTAIAPVAGALVYRSDAGQQTTLGALLGFVPNEGNAWHYTLDALRRFFVQVLTRAPHGQPALPGRPFLDAAEHELPPIVPDLIGPYLESVRLMGQRTAELHIALASIGDNADFAPEPFTLSYQRSLYQTVRTRVSQVLDGLRERQADLPEKDREDAQRLQERKSDLLLHLRPILERRITAQRIRCHGDYRLDSLLFTGRDFVIGDFEGDVSRHLSNRRRKRSPLRDVASMLYSFYFAVGAGLYAGDLRPDDLPLLRPWARFWHVWVAVAFLKSYLESASSAGFLPTTRDELQVLLDFYLLSRGLGELRARLDGRLDLVDIPLQALLHILELRDHPAQ